MVASEWSISKIPQTPITETAVAQPLERAPPHRTSAPVSDQCLCGLGAAVEVGGAVHTSCGWEVTHLSYSFILGYISGLYSCLLDLVGPE